MNVRPDYLDPIPRRVSPDGSVVVLYTASEMRMSLWVHEPLVFRARDEMLLVDLTGTLLDCAHATSFPEPGRVRLGLRRYPHGGVVKYDLVVDVEAETFGLGGAPPDRPLAKLPGAILELGGGEGAVRRADLASGLCPDCGGDVRRVGGLSSFLGWRRVQCAVCGKTWRQPRTDHS